MPLCAVPHWRSVGFLDRQSVHRTENLHASRVPHLWSGPRWLSCRPPQRRWAVVARCARAKHGMAAFAQGVTSRLDFLGGDIDGEDAQSYGDCGLQRSARQAREEVAFYGVARGMSPHETPAQEAASACSASSCQMTISAPPRADATVIDLPCSSLAQATDSAQGPRSGSASTTIGSRTWRGRRPRRSTRRWRPRARPTRKSTTSR